MNDRDPDEEIIAEIERQIAAGTDLDDLTPVVARTPRNPRAVFSMRFSPDEISVISAAAREAGVPLSDFIRQAALTIARSREDPDSRHRIAVVEQKVNELKEAVSQL